MVLPELAKILQIRGIFLSPSACCKL